MGFIILLAFIAIPLIEIAVFIEVGGFIGLWWTLFIVVGTALAGTYMLRRQGLSTLRRAQLQMAEGRMPLRELFDGLCLLFAGALLLTPGFVTDLAGALLLMPPVREFLGRLVARHIVANNQFHDPSFDAGGPRPAGPHSRPSPPSGRGASQHDIDHDDIIDVDFEEVTPDDPAPIDDHRDDQGKTK